MTEACTPVNPLATSPRRRLAVPSPPSRGSRPGSGTADGSHRAAPPRRRVGEKGTSQASMHEACQHMAHASASRSPEVIAWEQRTSIGPEASTGAYRSPHRGEVRRCAEEAHESSAWSPALRPFLDIADQPCGHDPRRAMDHGTHRSQGRTLCASHHGGNEANFGRWVPGDLLSRRRRSRGVR